MRKTAVIILASAAAAFAAAAPASTNPTLNAKAPWWERITVTMSSDGKPHSCRYESSSAAGDAECEVAPGQAATAKAAEADGQLTRITFERRFTPDVPGKPALKAGDTLLGGQVMALAIDDRGAVKDCKVVATSGSVKPEYSCSDVAAERFEASLGDGGNNASGRRGGAERAGYMTILVYGHNEHLV